MIFKTFVFKKSQGIASDFSNNEFKKSLNGKTISIHGKEYATVALRVAIARRVLGTALDIVTKIISNCVVITTAARIRIIFVI